MFKVANSQTETHHVAAMHISRVSLTHEMQPKRTLANPVDLVDELNLNLSQDLGLGNNDMLSGDPLLICAEDQDQGLNLGGVIF